MKYQRSTTASRRAARRIVYVHISKPITKEWLETGKGPKGVTYDRRRNENKRKNRQADIRWRVKERMERA